MKKVFILIFLSFFIFGIAVNPLISAQETLENPGITPDSFLWGIDKALEQILLLLATSPNTKATKGLENAEERLAEIKEMIEENKLDAAEKAKKSHGETLAEVQQNIEEVEEDNSTEEMKEVIKIEKELQDHNNEVKQVFGELKIKIKVEGKLTQAQQDLIDSILASLEGQTGEVEIEIKNKKDKTKIKIKIETGKSDEEVEDEIEKLEIEEGLGRIKIKAEIVGGQSEVKIERRFSTTTTDKEAIINEIIEEFVLNRETANAALKIEDDENDEELEEKFKVEIKIKEGTAKVKVKLKFILNTTDREEILNAIVENSQLTIEQIEGSLKFRDKDKDEEEKDEDEELEIEVEIEDGIAEVEIEFNGEELEFSLETTDKEEIISEIIERTGLTREEIEAVIEFEIEDEEREDDKEEESDEKNEGENRITVEILSENNSNESGRARLVEENGQVTVTISMDGAPEDVSQPAHIHLGSCPEVGGVQYPLTNILNEESITTINATLDQLKSELPLAINIHKSVNESSVYVSCGNLIFN